jgi:hypothetical protein
MHINRNFFSPTYSAFLKGSRKGQGEKAKRDVDHYARETAQCTKSKRNARRETWKEREREITHKKQNIREKERQRDRETERQRKKEKKRKREKERKREREKERKRDRERER